MPEAASCAQAGVRFRQQGPRRSNQGRLGRTACCPPAPRGLTEEPLLLPWVSNAVRDWPAISRQRKDTSWRVSLSTLRPILFTLFCLSSPERGARTASGLVPPLTLLVEIKPCDVPV